jgi:hypothetical protein
MRRSPISAALLCVLVYLLFGLLFWVHMHTGPSIALAQPLPPRPTPRPTAVPTAQPKGGNDSPTPQPSGRITGTVIDLTTGAPAPGITVVVGDVTVSTDANGNYDRTGLPAGSYSVALMLAEGQGAPAQGPITVVLAADATVVQHLFFRSLLAATATPAAALIPPANLPTTNGSDSMGGLLVLLGVGAIVLGGAIRMVRQGRRSR